jgi:hypothetical protein
MFEKREISFFPSAATLQVGDIVLEIGRTKVDNGPLQVLELEQAPGAVRAHFQNTADERFWVTLVPNYEVTLKPPF